MEILSIPFIKKRIQQSRSNAARQRKSQQFHPVRVQASFWEQVERDYKAQLKQVAKYKEGTAVCECGSEEYFIAPIVGARCNKCQKPLG